jgi:beta-galactosidase
LDETASQPSLRLFHDEEADIFINGALAAHVTGHVGQYVEVSLSAEAVQALRLGENTVAVHCHQTTGGQYIDVGIVDLVPASK